MTDHFTAWVTTDRSVLTSEYADIVITRDDKGPNGWVSTYDLHLSHLLSQLATADHDAILKAADEALRHFGWQKIGSWNAGPSGYKITVERVER